MNEQSFTLPLKPSKYSEKFISNIKKSLSSNLSVKLSSGPLSETPSNFLTFKAMSSISL